MFKSVMFWSGSVRSGCQNAPGANFRSGPVVGVLPVVVSGPVRLLVFSVRSGPVVDFGHAHVKERVFNVLTIHDQQQLSENRSCFSSLEETSPWDPAHVKERQIWRPIASTRALYDQMAPQLCQF